MYSTCIFCHSTLGKNEAIEHFPVGRKLAFDGAKGRLWAVCGKCGRWNLTPIEERWEAIEECERQYRGVITRSSTDNIGLGRVKEGTDLIRIGEPLRPEFASWRYGRFFRRRRQLNHLATAIGWGGSLALWAISGAFTSAGFLGTTLIFKLITRNSELGRARRLIALRAEEGFGKKLSKGQDVGIRIIPFDDDQGWALRFALSGKFLDFHGAEAVHTAQLVSPAINASGAAERAIAEAVREIELVGSPQEYFRSAVKFNQLHDIRYTNLGEYPEVRRLAFEMAAHEESERAVLEGELTQLEADWREAEEVAAIADNMFLPAAISDFIERHKPAAREKQ